MRYFAWPEGKSLMEQINIPLTFEGTSEWNCVAQFPIPDVTQRKDGLAVILATATMEEGNAAMWLANTDIWQCPSVDILAQHLLLSIHPEASKSDSPVVTFAEGEVEQAIALTALALFGYWDFVLAPADGSFVFRGSHDEFGEIWTREKSLELPIIADLQAAEYLQ